MGATGVQGQSCSPPKAESILRIFGWQTMQNLVYLSNLSKLLEPLVKREKNLGCSACLFSELSVVIDRANNHLAEFNSQILP